MTRRALLVVLGLLLGAGCIHRAPTTYELDRRAGFPVPPPAVAKKGEPVVSQDLDKVRTSSAVAQSPRMPVKVPPLIERVWVSDIPLGPDARLQGTWLFLEVERGKWLDEVDPGGGPLIDLDWKRRANPQQPAAPATGGAATAPEASRNVAPEKRS
jgi:hypothetical protein